MQANKLDSGASAHRVMSFLIASVLLALLPIFLPAAHAQSSELQTFTSRFYTIHTNMDAKEVRDLGRHMDEVFAEYKKRFRSADIHARKNDPMPLYLLRTQEDYMRFMASMGIDATNSGGIFFIQPSIRKQGLATYVEGRSPSETKSVLQHEGFHQFADQYIGDDLPIWVNEGIAQYFEAGILVRKGLELDLVSGDRIRDLQQAVADNHHLPFDNMLNMTPQAWSANLARSIELGSLQYHQAWSMVHFLINGNKGRYRKPFEDYLKLVAKRTPSDAAFKRAFGANDSEPFEKAWREFVVELKPDPISTAAERLSFLARGLRYLHENKQDVPADLDQLKATLQNIQFRSLRRTGRTTTEISAADEENFVYDAGAQPIAFQLLPAEKDDLPPRLTAPRMRPTPTLEWSRDKQGNLVDDIVWK